MVSKRVKQAIFALIIANLIWGAAPPIFKLALTDIHPYTLAFLRFFLASLLMLPFMKSKFKVQGKDYIKVFLIGFFGITINIIFFFLGLLYAPSINASIIGSAGPVFIILFSFLLLRAKPRKKILVGALLGLIGVLMFLITPLFRTGAHIVSLGNVFLLISALGGIVHAIIGHDLLKKYSVLIITFWSFVIGTLSFVPFFVQEVNQYGFLPNLSIQGLAGIIFGAVLSSFVAYYLYNSALKLLPAADVSIFAYLDPIATLIVAAWLLGEKPDSIFIIGALLVFGGIFIAEGRIHWHPIHKLFK